MSQSPERLSVAQQIFVGTGLLALAAFSVDLFYTDPADKADVRAAQESIAAWQTDPNKDTLSYFQGLSERQEVRADAEDVLSNTRQRMLYEVVATCGALAATSSIEAVRRRRQS